MKKAEANAAAVVERVRAAMDAVRGTLPGGMDLVWVSDEGSFIQASADSALTNIVVLLPIAVMEGMVGRFLQPFATTMIVVIAVSLFISFTLTPLLASKLLRARAAEGERGWLDRLAAAQRRSMDRISGLYGRGLAWLGRHRWAIGLLLLGIVGAAAGVAGQADKLGFSLVAESDRGEVFVKLEYATRSELGQTIERVHDVEERLRGLPGLQRIYTTVGKVDAGIGQVSEGVYLGQILLKFVPRTERSETLTDLLAAVRNRLQGLAGCIVTVGFPSAMGGQTAPLELSVMGASLETLDELAGAIEDLAEGLPETIEIDTTVRPGKPELRVRPRRAVLADLGLPPAQLGLTLRANLAGLVAGAYKQGARSYDIRVKLAEEEGKRQVEDFLFPAAPGRPLVLATLAEVDEERAPIQVNRLDKKRTTKIFANLPHGVPIGTAVERLQAAIDREITLPPGYEARFTGQYEVMAESNAAFGQALLIAVVLIGIVVNNAILVMESLGKYRAEGLSPADAMVRASSEQLRPVLMITLAAALGMLPLALGTGLGSEPRVGIGAASIAGILVSGVLTLVVQPGLYLLFTRQRPSLAGAEGTPAPATDTDPDGDTDTDTGDDEETNR